MGRSPYWHEYVVPLPARPVPESLLALAEAYQHLAPPLDMNVSDGIVTRLGTSFSSKSPLLVQVLETGSLPIEVQWDMGLMRSCSSYGMDEESSPSVGKTYRVTDAVTYTIAGIDYDIFHLHRWIDGADAENSYCSFLLRLDGTVMNIESLQAISYVDKALVTLPKEKVD